MPSREGKSSANCCTGRNPPSPDGDPPRPAVSPTKVPHQATKDIISSGSTGATAELAELRPIFEEDKEPYSEIIPARLAALLVSDKSENEEESAHVKPRKSTSTLSAVKQKLKKHLSLESNLAKRRSISSVGTSEEEVERRAELRRIRHKRIQDELSNEASYDDDAKTLSSIAGADTTLGMAIYTSWVPGDTLPFPRVLSPSLSCTALPIPEVPHLEEQSETGETTVTEDNGSHIVMYQQDSTPKNKPRGISRLNGTILRRHSSPILKEGQVTNFQQQEGEARMKSDIPPVPLAPVLQPKKLPSITEPPRSSWRLSFASQNRCEHLRKLSQEHKTLTPKRLEESASQPSLRRWLHGQGLRSTSNFTVNLEGCVTTESLTSSMNSSSDLGGVDGGAERHISTIHLHEMGIAQRLASGTLAALPSSPKFNGWGAHRRGNSSLSNTSCFLRVEREKFLRNTSDSLPLSEQIPQSWGTVIPEKGSSLYYSTANGIHLSPESSRFNLASILTRGKGKSANEEMIETKAPQSERVLSTSTTASDCFPHYHPPTRQVRKPAFDDSSLLVSETDSFREREAELSMVKARFASTEARRSPSTPVSSKFREEFDMEPEMSDSPIVRRPSKFAKLAKTFAIKAYDGTPMEELLEIPMPSFTPSEPGKVKPLAEEALGGTWGDGLRKKSGVNRDRKASDEPKTVFGGLSLMKKKSKNKVDIANHRSAAEEYQQRFDERLHVKELVMGSWEEEMAAIAGKAKARSKNIVKKEPTGPDLRYPASWAKFPTHSRHERSFSAGRPDNIQARDFAMKSAGHGEPTWYLHERKHHLYHYEGDDHPSHVNDDRKKNIVEKVHKIIKEEIKNYENKGEDPDVEDTFGRRSSLNPPLKLDFPELEILPMEVRTAAQQEKEVVEQIEEANRLQELADTDMGTIDGSMDEEAAGRNVSIADPKFYQDCLVHKDQKTATGAHHKKGKYKTWSGKDWDAYRSLSASSFGSGCGSGKRRRKEVSLRKSTQDYHNELKALEKLERDRVLGLVEEVWGKNRRQKSKNENENEEKIELHEQENPSQDVLEEV